MNVGAIATTDYDYDLPVERIAKFSLGDRQTSKLLVCQHQRIQHSSFEQIDTFLPPHSTLVFNNTRVIPARLIFKKHTGACVEVFLLTPWSHGGIHEQIMHAKGSCVWQCLVGNKRKWKPNEDLVIESAHGTVFARWLADENGLVSFRWNEKITFSTLLQQIGQMPLPPYLGREAQKIDKTSYQTVFAQVEGAVAAPTAGLHFTEDLLKQLQEAAHHLCKVTLHVSAGTFLPIKTTQVLEHPMHRESISISKNLITHLATTDSPIIGVGTTSVRVLESTFWYGMHLMEDNDTPFFIGKTTPYERTWNVIDRKKVFERILAKMNETGVGELRGHTELMIVPGYRFGVIDGLITNFHQPQSTLILLIAAWLGEAWRFIYQEALTANYRFLSYGDACLFLS